MIINMVGGGGSSSSAYAMILVNYPSTATSCTCTGSSGSKAITSTQKLFYIPSSGSYTVTISNGTDTATETVGITYEGQSVTVTLDFRVPSAYQEVEYLESSGTQCIFAGISETSDSLDVEVDGYATGGGYNVFGCVVNAGPYFFTCTQNYTGATAIFRYSTAAQQSYSATAARHKFRLNGNEAYIDDVLQGTFTGNSFTVPNMGLFGRYQEGALINAGPCRIYSATIKVSGTLIRDFIPCYRKSDSVAGMWDTVNKVFYTNDGTGTFVVGGDVS